MKKYLDFISESTKPRDEKEVQWFKAIAANDFKKVESLIKRGIDVNIKNDFGVPSLNFAIYSSIYGDRKRNIVKLILDRPNININYQDVRNGPAFLYAVRNGVVGIIELFLKHPKLDINILEQNGTGALTIASEQCDVYIVKQLLMQPKIKIDCYNEDDHDFINILGYKNAEKNIIDYHFQKRILMNNREDIIIFLNKYNLVDKKIKKEYAHLFTGADLNLL